MTFERRQIKTASLLFLFVAGLSLLSGCSRKACFAWTAAEGACPSQLDAPTFFGQCNDILSVDSEGSFADDLCCYEVSKTGDELAPCVGPGPEPGTSSGFSSASFSSSSSGVFPGACDAIGICDPPDGNGCFNCALKSICAPQLDMCLSQMECISFSDCTLKCTVGDKACADDCQKSFPGGVAPFQELVDCVVCLECPASCFMSDFVVPASCQPTDPTGTGGMSGAGGMGGAGGAGGAGGSP